MSRLCPNCRHRPEKYHEEEFKKKKNQEQCDVGRVYALCSFRDCQILATLHNQQVYPMGWRA